MAIAVHVYDIIVLHAGRGPTLIDSKLYIFKKTSYNSSQVPKFLISNSDRTRWYLFECCCNVHDPRNLILFSIVHVHKARSLIAPQLHYIFQWCGCLWILLLSITV